MTEIPTPDQAAMLDEATARFRALIAGEIVPDFPIFRPPEGETPAPSSWAPVDLDELLDGSYVVPRPTLMPREDGHCLLYPGKVHSFVGESESGKSLLAQLESIRLVNAGEDVLYLDWEDQAAGVVERMLTFGADPAYLRKHFHYVNPEATFAAPTDRDAWINLLGRRFALAVIDGVNDSLAMFGRNPNDGAEVSAWQQAIARKLARQTGAAVLLIDHVTKSHEGRGRSAIGSEKKLSGLDGCSYVVEPTTMPRKGHVGWVTVKVGKDRPGGVRPNCGPPGRDRLQHAATIKIDSTGPMPLVWWNVPEMTEAVSAPSVEDKLAAAMERVSTVLEEVGEPISKNALAAKCGGARNTCMAAIDELNRLGYVEIEPGSRGAFLVKNKRIYVNGAPVLTCTPPVLTESSTGAADLYSAPPSLGGAGSTGQAGLNGEVTCTEPVMWNEALADVIPLSGGTAS